MVIAALVLFPRTTRLKYLRGGPLINQSPTFFGDLGRLSFEGFLHVLTVTPDEDVERDEREQAYILVRIANVKMSLVRGSITLITLSVVLLGVIALLA